MIYIYENYVLNFINSIFSKIVDKCYTFTIFLIFFPKENIQSVKFLLQ